MMFKWRLSRHVIGCRIGPTAWKVLDGGGGGGGGGGRRFVRVWKPVVPRPWFRRMPISIRPFLDRISMGAVRVLTRFQEVGRVWSRVWFSACCDGFTGCQFLAWHFLVGVVRVRSCDREVGKGWETGETWRRALPSIWKILEIEMGFQGPFSSQKRVSERYFWGFFFLFSFLTRGFCSQFESWMAVEMCCISCGVSHMAQEFRLHRSTSPLLLLLLLLLLFLLLLFFFFFFFFFFFSVFFLLFWFLFFFLRFWFLGLQGWK